MWELVKNLEDALVESTKGDLEGIVGAIVESPSPADRQPHGSAGPEHGSHPVPAEILHCLIHQPVGVPAIDVERLPVHCELSPIPPHEGPHRLSLFYPAMDSQVPVEVPEGQVDEGNAGGEAENWVRHSDACPHLMPSLLPTSDWPAAPEDLGQNHGEGKGISGSTLQLAPSRLFLKEEEKEKVEGLNTPNSSGVHSEKLEWTSWCLTMLNPKHQSL